MNTLTEQDIQALNEALEADSVFYREATFYSADGWRGFYWKPN